MDKLNSKSITFRAKPEIQELIDMYRSTNDISTTLAIEELLGYGALVWLNSQYQDEEVTK